MQQRNCLFTLFPEAPEFYSTYQLQNVKEARKQEQVEKNKDDILSIINEQGTLNQFGLKVVEQYDTLNQLVHTCYGNQHFDSTLLLIQNYLLSLTQQNMNLLSSVSHH